MGNVEIASPQFTGRANSLSATFQMRPAAANAGAGGAKSGADTPATASAPAAAPFGLPGTSPGGTTPQQRYFIETNQMRLELFLTGQSAAPSSLACDGNVVLRKVPLVPTDQQPLEIRGGQLLVDRLDTKSPHVTLHGAAPGEAAGSASPSWLGAA